MAARKVQKVLIRATEEQETQLKRLQSTRTMLKNLKGMEVELTQSLVAAIGSADGIISDTVQGTLSRCQGQVAWKRVVDHLIASLDIDPRLLEEAIEGARGDDYVQLRIKEPNIVVREK
jgi:hypothetical protein